MATNIVAVQNTAQTLTELFAKYGFTAIKNETNLGAMNADVVAALRNMNDADPQNMNQYRAQIVSSGSLEKSTITGNYHKTHQTALTAPKL